MPTSGMIAVTTAANPFIRAHHGTVPMTGNVGTRTGRIGSAGRRLEAEAVAAAGTGAPVGAVADPQARAEAPAAVASPL
jgi:hypothetical protein